MSGDPEAPSSGSAGAGQPRQQVPAASPPALPSAIDQAERRERSAAVKFAGVGLQFALTLLVGLGLGAWADKRFGTSIFVYFGVFLGAGAAFYSMYRQLMANLEREEQAKRARQGSAGESSPHSSSPRASSGREPRRPGGAA